MKNRRNTPCVAFVATIATIVVGALWPAPASAQVTSDDRFDVHGWINSFHTRLQWIY